MLESKRKGSAASLPQHNTQGLDFSRTTAKRDNHGGGFLKLLARSKRETGAKLDGFLVPRWKGEGAAMPEGL